MSKELEQRLLQDPELERRGQGQLAGTVLGYLVVACIAVVVLVGSVAAVYAICTTVWG